jgi:hypothetical protein
MTSFFFTFFKVFLNGCWGLFVTTLPRLLKIHRADKFFFYFFFFAPGQPNQSALPAAASGLSLLPSGAPVHAVTEVSL